MMTSAPTATATGGSVSTRAQWLVLAAAFLGWMFDGVEMGIFPLVARPALQSMMPASALGQDQFVGLWMGRITALFLVGAAVGGLGFGWLGDRLGRVRAMTLSILTYSVFTGLCFFAQEPWQLGALAVHCRSSGWAASGRWASRWSWKPGRPANARCWPASSALRPTPATCSLRWWVSVSRSPGSRGAGS